MKRFTQTLLGVGIFATSLSVQAASISYTFNLPATSSYVPPYPDVATLTITEYSGGLQFTLDPNQDSPGTKTDPSESFIDSLDLAYSGTTLTSGAFTDTNSTNTPIVDFDVSNNPNIDAGYKVTNGTDAGGYLSFRWDQGAGFDFTEISTWTIDGLELSDFSFWFAETNSNKPNPINGIISTSSYQLPNNYQSTTSNWVDGPSAVPIPAAAFLFAPALLGFFGLRRKLSQA